MRMKTSFSLTVIIAAAVMTVYSCSEGSSENPEATQSGTVNGDRVYADNCVICHGQDGKAGVSGATDLSTSTLSHEAAVNVVTNGRNGMRAFKELTKEEIEAVVSHIETLRK